MLWIVSALASVEDARTPDHDTLPMAEVAIELATGAQDEGQGTVWTWTKVVFGPCVESDDDRRWTWLSDRDALRVGICGEEGEFEVRLTPVDRRPLPRISKIVLNFEQGELELQRNGERWTGSPEAMVSLGSSGLSSDFSPAAEARYREVRDTVDALVDRVEELTHQETDFDPLEDRDPGLWDAADWDIEFDGPDGYMGTGFFFDDDFDSF